MLNTYIHFIHDAFMQLNSETVLRLVGSTLMFSGSIYLILVPNDNLNAIQKSFISVIPVIYTYMILFWYLCFHLTVNDLLLILAETIILIIMYITYLYRNKKY